LSIHFFLGCLLMAGLAQAAVSLSPQSGTSNFLDDTSSFARSAAMGSAFVGIADDASALVDNPAGLAYLSQAQVLTNSNLWLVDTYQETLLLGIPNSPGWGGWAFAGSFLDFGTFQGRDATGTLAPNYSADLLILKAGWGLEIFKGLSLGAGLQGAETNLVGESSWVFAPDLGILFKPNERLRLGAAFDDIEVNPSPGTAGTVFHLGASLEIPLDPTSRLLTALTGTLDPSTFNGLEAGMEYGLQKALFLRAGYQMPLEDTGVSGLTGFTAGVGFEFSGLKLDYAYLPYGELGASHRLSLGYWFGSGKPAASTPSPSPGWTPPPVAGLPQPPIPSTQSRQVPGAPPGSFPCEGFSLPPDDIGKVEGLGTIVPKPTAVPTPPAGGVQTPLNYSPDRENPPGDQGPLVVEFDFLSDAAAQGKSLEKQGRCLEAVQLYLNAVKKDPQDASAWQELGNLYYRLKYKDDAIYCFEQVIGLEPDKKDLAGWLERYQATR
jgi:hypothetical protein